MHQKVDTKIHIIVIKYSYYELFVYINFWNSPINFACVSYFCPVYYYPLEYNHILN